MAKDNSIKVFLAFVRAGLWEQGLNLLPLGFFSFQKVYQLAQEQSVVGLVAAGFDQLVDYRVRKEIALIYAGEVLHIEQRNKAINEFHEKLIEKFQSEGIDAIVVKGQGVAQCYERPLWRASGDVDLLLDDDNFIKAQKYLTSISKNNKGILKEEKHQEFEVGPWIVELHGNMPTHFSSKTDRLLEELQKEAIDEGKVRAWKCNEVDVKLLNVDADVIFVFTHILKHFFRGGIGLRQICDWCRLLWTYKDQFDRGLLERRLKKAGLMTEWRAFAALAVKELGYPEDAMPLYSDKPKWGRKSSRILIFILKTGNFGHNRNTTYYQKYPYLVTKVISFYWRAADNIRYFFVFPADSFRVFGWLIRHGVNNL